VELKAPRVNDRVAAALHRSYLRDRIHEVWTLRFRQ
jgi:hypothetical protein